MPSEIMMAGDGTSPGCQDWQEGRSALLKSFQVQAGDVMITETHREFRKQRCTEGVELPQAHVTKLLAEGVTLTAEHAPLCSASLTEDIA